MFLEEFCEGRNRDVEGVATIVLFQFLEFCGLCDAPRLLERLDGRLWFRVDGIVEGSEALLVGMVQESALLEEE